MGCCVNPEPDWLGEFIDRTDELDLDEWFELMDSLEPCAIDAYHGRLTNKRYKASEEAKSVFRKYLRPHVSACNPHASALIRLMDAAEYKLEIYR